LRGSEGRRHHRDVLSEPTEPRRAVVVHGRHRDHGRRAHELPVRGRHRDRHRLLRSRAHGHGRHPVRELLRGAADGLDVLRLDQQCAQHPARLRAPAGRAGLHQFGDRNAPHELGPAQGGVPVMTMRATTSGSETIMKRWTMAVLAALAVAGAPRPVHAVGPIIDWDPAYCWQPGATFDNLPAGGVMQIVGTVSAFGAPLDFLNPTLPATEYTFYITGLSSGGTTATGVGLT